MEVKNVDRQLEIKHMCKNWHLNYVANKIKEKVTHLHLRKNPSYKVFQWFNVTMQESCCCSLLTPKHLLTYI